ncbi:coenzyme F420-0:L-glutamate ligase/coenzyme F420-1:gamma-L-glutamate ligase [Methanohalophilus levihalophilus]|uniref:coenzyme F420-0:L-glutamate ligase n=1 Tax=Methanohalophilus levihalophilus TaxID=1431282 RepID=UPI001AE1AE9B|nr:coenzyme F420-0:L-glutamate ligase [Methanohalophilus levihalophilus]MBP2030085.1 coenzyme F420-0:L-glutamate ligase/coenzyme F420-1:gamma-L-glutamate ligase [Methanohalophilus levihalophilus]
MKMEVLTVDGLPLVQPGDNIAQMICENIALEDGDIVVIASTIVAKAEGRLFTLEGIVPGELALRLGEKGDRDPRIVQAVLDRSHECLIGYPMMLMQSKGAHVCINAGIDDSNVEGGKFVELPEDSDASACAIGEELERLSGKSLSVIITDTNGRAFRIGQTGVAIGVYHIKPIKDWKGTRDLFGLELKISEEAVADEVAAAANILMGEGNGGNPVVIVRGLNLRTDREVSITDLYRPDNEDIVKQALRSFKQV